MNLRRTFLKWFLSAPAVVAVKPIAAVEMTTPVSTAEKLLSVSALLPNELPDPPDWVFQYSNLVKHSPPWAWITNYYAHDRKSYSNSREYILPNMFDFSTHPKVDAKWWDEDASWGNFGIELHRVAADKALGNEVYVVMPSDKYSEFQKWASECLSDLVYATEYFKDYTAVTITPKIA